MRDLLLLVLLIQFTIGSLEGSLTGEHALAPDEWTFLWESVLVFIPNESLRWDVFSFFLVDDHLLVVVLAFTVVPGLVPVL